MAKRFKLKLTVPSFQICRSKNLSNFPGNPVPAIYRLSPVNPKARDIGYPPSPSEDRFAIPCNCKLSSKIISMADGCPSKTYKNHVPYYQPTDFAASACRQKTHCESVFAERNDDKEKKVKSRGISSGRSDLLVNKLGKKDDDDDDNNDNEKEEERETLISCMSSFSDEFFDEIDHSPETASPKLDKEIGRHRRRISSIKKVRRLRFQTSRNQTGLEIGETRKTVMSTKTGCFVTCRGPTRSCTVEGKVRESFAVVKKSKDPYDDFKKSMLEMIMEMEMFEAKDLEQLLQCFLTLNSRRYHGVIVQAFMEIWKELFYEFCVDPKSPKKH